MSRVARCPDHPERDATETCVRCGTFVCTGCVVRGGLCTACRSRLLREGIAWSEPEQDRTRARELRQLGGRLLWISVATGAGAAAAVLGWRAGAASLVVASVGWLLAALSAASGAGAGLCAGFGHRASARGRPGPALRGVFPAGAALLMAGLGALPSIALASALWAALSGGDP